MKYICDFALWLLLLWRICSIQGQSTSFYRRTYYNAAAASPPGRHLYANHRSTSLAYAGDLVPQESKRKDKSSKPYSKKIPFRPYISEEDDVSQEQYLSSAEYSNESRGGPYNSHSSEHDSREIAIGTQIRVQHPAPKKSAYSTLPSKPKPSSLRSTESPKKPRTPKYSGHYEADPFHVVAPPKSTAASQRHNPSAYNVYEDEQDTYVPAKGRNKGPTNNYDRYKGVPSKKQIEKYLEDQEKYLEESVQSQLRNNPKYQKYLAHNNEDDRESESDVYETEYQANPPPAFRGSYNDNFHQLKSKPRPRRRPAAAELKRSPKRPPPPNRKYRSAIVINV